MFNIDSDFPEKYFETNKTVISCFEFAQQGDAHARELLLRVFEFGEAITEILGEEDEEMEDIALVHEWTRIRGLNKTKNCSIGITLDKKENFEDAFYFFKKAADENDPVGSFFLGWYYDAGKGVEQSLDSALKYYKIAADHGIVLAQICYAMKIMETIKNSKNNKDREEKYDLIIKYLSLAFENGSAVAISELGNFYLVHKNSCEEALKCYILASERNNANGLIGLGAFYESGDLVEKSITNAEKCYLKAAALEASTAYFELGKLYETNPSLCLHHNVIAAYYYRIGAELDDLRAQYEIARLYETGKLSFLNISKEHCLKKAIFFYQLVAKRDKVKHGSEYVEASKKKLTMLTQPLIHGIMKPKNGREFYISEPPQDRGGIRRFILIPAVPGKNIKDSTLHQAIWEKRLAVVFRESDHKEAGFIVSDKWMPDNMKHLGNIKEGYSLFSGDIEIIVKIASKNYLCDSVWMHMADDAAYEHYRKECSEVFNKELAEFNRKKLQKEMKGEAC